jgi:hypothetical protein
MSIHNVVFPLYKLRSYISIERTPLDTVVVTTIKGKYILDDKSINAPFSERRIELLSRYPKDKIYKLKERVPYLRQLVKYKSGTTFIDYNGEIFKYKKSSRLFKVKSHRIEKKRKHGNWTIFNVSNIEIPFIVGELLPYNANYASIMHTTWGPFLYDITSEPHEVYRRKL